MLDFIHTMYLNMCNVLSSSWTICINSYSKSGEWTCQIIRLDIQPFRGRDKCQLLRPSEELFRHISVNIASTYIKLQGAWSGIRERSIHYISFIERAHMDDDPCQIIPHNSRRNTFSTCIHQACMRSCPNKSSVSKKVDDEWDCSVIRT
jgi:hypothetical protein